MAVDAAPETGAPPVATVGGDGDGTAPPASRGGGVLGRAWQSGSNFIGVGGLLLILIAYLTIAEDQFATSGNVINILETNAVLLIVAVGLTFVILSGGFDLSLGGLLALTSVIMWKCLDAGLPTGVAIAIAVAAATLLGLCVNGVLITKVGLSFLVVTLATSYIFRGLAQIHTEGQSQSLFTEDFLVELGSGRIGGVPWAVIIALAVFAIGLLVLRYTGFGRMLFAVGGNPEAARVAGINVSGVRLAVYGIAGLLTGVAAVIDAGRLASASPEAGFGIELTAGAAVLLGGTTFMGGRGTMFGTLLGVLFLGVLENGITLLHVQSFWQDVVVGVVLVTALLLDRLKRHPGGP